MALRKNLDKSNWSLILRDQNRRGRREEEEEEEKRRRKGDKKRYEFYDFWYGYYIESEDLMVLYGILGNFMSSKPRVSLGIDPNYRFE